MKLSNFGRQSALIVPFKRSNWLISQLKYVDAFSGLPQASLFAPGVPAG
ncbi:hypothetical protein IQ259_00510 [Fortiea sp. LEGE XX443]|nr:hypothetical protein [Fortiea sp. LEGE XX443]MBE9003549.1 hypothetical protein [Fortiea sp. LEGE XX443]